VVVKKVQASTSKAKAASIRDLVDYIREPHDQCPTEKVLYAHARGFICDTHAAQREEMVALASEAVRSRNPVNHYILSWREGEQPSPEQVEEAVTIFLEAMGWTDHQVIYALHRNTDNLHLHIAINRVHPETRKIVEVYRGFDIEAAHKAIARIEHVQGWQREKRGRYQVLETGELARAPDDPEPPRRPSARARDLEQRTGEQSAQRIAIDVGAPIIRRAQTWEQLHRELAAQGMRYEKTGSGAVLFVGDVPIKASAVERNASLAKLQKRLGAYRPAPARQQVAPREPQPIKPDAPGWQAYIAERQAHYAAKNAAKLALDQRQEHEFRELLAKQKARREELLRGNWRGRGALLNALRSVIAAEHAAEKARLREQHQRQRAQWRTRFQPYPDFEEWQRMRGRPDLADQWRYRASEPQRLEGDRDALLTPRDIRDFVPEILGAQVHYRRGGGAGGVSFVDRGQDIEIYDWRDRDTVLAAMQLAAQKWGGIHVSGCAEYIALCVRLAAEHGFKIVNPELQDRIQQERQRIQEEGAQAMKCEQLRQFERYAEAVNADRYRVTSIMMRADGSKLTFILDKRDGITRGFTPQEIAARMPEMRRLQQRGENLYYTPLSDRKHHILIDDMSREKLDRLLADGYKPAVVLESSPGNFQAIITVPKLGTPHDRDVGNRLAEHLNREYGDPRLSGAIHPHRAPGFENRKPKHRQADGSYPVVRLIIAERRECSKTLALSREIDAEYQRQAAARAAQQPERSRSRITSDLVLAEVNDDAVKAYQRHYRDVLGVLQKRGGGGPLDLSRVDAMIAVRMRITGHDQEAIEAAIRRCAPGIRPTAEGRNWDDYARRTARYAYSAAGDRQAAQLTHYRPQWERLEGREPQQARPEDEEPAPELVPRFGM